MTVQSIQRALIIMSLFTRQRTQIGITEIGRVLGVTKGAAHNLVTTLVEGGFLRQDSSTKKYALGFKVLEIGMLQPQAQDLNQNAMGPSMALSRALRFVTRVAIWDGEAVLVTLTNYPKNRPELSNSVGPRLHAYCTSLGKAILANLPPEEFDKYLDESELVSFTPATITDKEILMHEIRATRERGFSIDREESLLGIACLGAPIFDGNNEILGALSLSGLSKRLLNKDRLDDLAADLLRTADEISRSLGYLPKLADFG